MLVVFSHPVGKHHSWLSSDSVLLSTKVSLFGHLTTKEPSGSSLLLLHCTIQSFPIATRGLGTMTSADFSRLALLRYGSSICFLLRLASVRPPLIRALTFHLIPAPFTPTAPNSYRALVCLATFPTVICLV